MVEAFADDAPESRCRMARPAAIAAGGLRRDPEVVLSTQTTAAMNAEIEDTMHETVASTEEVVAEIGLAVAPGVALATAAVAPGAIPGRAAAPDLAGPGPLRRRAGAVLARTGTTDVPGLLVLALAADPLPKRTATLGIKVSFFRIDLSIYL